MATRYITTKLTVDGEREYKKQLSEVNGELRNLKSEMALTTEQFKGNANSMEALSAKSSVLTREVDQQAEKVRALERALKESSEAYGDSDKRTDGYRQSLNRAKTDLLKMQRELDDTNDLMQEAKQYTDKTARSIDGFGRDAKDAAGDLGSFNGNKGLGGMVESLGKLKGALAGGAVVAGVKELGDKILEVEESTREYRTIMGSLEISSQQAGYTAEETAAAYDHLYGVLGDSQTTATTVANLQAIGFEQTDLMGMIDACTGAWATYGDSIPIDGLAEAVNETIQTGKVTGVFADVLNWAGVSEDEFNAKLEACNGTSDRARTVLDQMAKQELPQNGREWRNLRDDVVDANTAQNNWEQAMGDLGETLAPAADAIRNFGADCIVWLTGKIEEGIKKLGDLWKDFMDLNNKLNETGVSVEQAKKNNPSLYDDKPRDQHGAYASHAGGLNRVPYDDYRASLHRDEAVLTAREAAVWRTMQRASASGDQSVGVADLQGVASAMMAGMSANQMSMPEEVRLVLTTEDGTELSRWLLPIQRNLNKSNPEVVSDTL